MTRGIQTVFFCCLVITTSAQTKTSKNAVGISIPVIGNTSAVDPGAKISGNAVSYGINFNYSRTIASKVYGVVGLGFFKQRFGMRRYYDLLNTNNGPALFTKSYSYNNIHLKFGLGYYFEIGENFSLHASVIHNEFYSFRQKYGKSVSHGFMSIGETVNLQLGINQQLTPNFSFATGVIYPVLVRWKTDHAFEDYPEIARNKLSLGIELSGKYHF